MPAVAFTDIFRIIVGIEVGSEIAFLVTRLHKGSCRIIDIPVVLGTFIKLVGNLRLTHLLGHHGDTIIIIGVFQRLGQGPTFPFLRIAVSRDISQLLILADSPVIVPVSRRDTGFERLFGVKVSDAFQVSIHYDGNGVITNHHISLPAIQVPQRQRSALFIEFQESFDHIVCPFGFGVGEERMSGAISVPQREGRIVRPSVRLVDLLIRAIVGTVHVAIDCRGDHGMIECGVELHHIVRIRTLYLYFGQLLVPFTGRLCLIVVEIVFRSFCTQVLACSFHADAGYSCRNEDFFIFLRIKVEAGDISCADPTPVFRRNGSCIDMAGRERFGEASLEINML